MEPNRIMKKMVQIPIWLVFVLFMVAAGTELTIRLFDFDWRLMERSFYYQTNQLRAHRPDPDPRILYRLRPGRVLQNHWITINTMGSRGPQRPPEKPTGVFRILVLGASNAFGAPEIKDDQTWPAQLEAKLNENHPGRFEVWNFGTNAYVGSQMAVLGEEMAEKLHPDLVLVGLASKGQRPFLWGAPIQHYFARNPSLWREVFPESLYRFPPWLSESSTLFLIRNLRIYRYALLAFTHYRLKVRPWQCAEHEQENVRATHNMIANLKGRTTVCLLIEPHLEAESYREYHEGTHADVIILKADGLPPEYRQIYPPPHVFAWYAEKIAEWIIDRYPHKSGAE